jgi:hypothetical protein
MSRTQADSIITLATIDVLSLLSHIPIVQLGQIYARHDVVRYLVVELDKLRLAHREQRYLLPLCDGIDMSLVSDSPEEVWFKTENWYSLYARARNQFGLPSGFMN